MSHPSSVEGPFGPTPADIAAVEESLRRKTQDGFVNCTPHEIRLVVGEGEEFTFPPSGTIVRVETDSEPVLHVGRATIMTEFPGKVVGLPDPIPGKFFIVSAMVRVACPDRLDVVSPGAPMRDVEGRIIGCGAFIVNFSPAWGE